MSDQLALIMALQEELAAEKERNLTLEKELREARWTADSAVRAKGSFIANMNHELRTPLNAILGFAELMREDVRDQHYVDLEYDLDKIMEASMRLLSLVNELLDLSKIETDTMELHLDEFRAAEAVEQAVRKVSGLIVDQGNDLTVAVDDDLTMYGDKRKVAAVLQNLLDNAAKFTAQGQIHLLVREITRGGRPALQFSVVDTGIGMTPEQSRFVFEAFTQADPSSKRHYEGTGLGLYISRKLCQLMQGDIVVKSQQGVGSNFTFWVPKVFETERTLMPT